MTDFLEIWKQLSRSATAAMTIKAAPDLHRDTTLALPFRSQTPYKSNPLRAGRVEVPFLSTITTLKPCQITVAKLSREGRPQIS